VATRAGSSRAGAGAGTRMFGALQVRDYRLLWIGLVISNVGSWMQLIALGWHVYLLTSSPFYLGLLGLARALPVFVFSLLGGVLADRVDRRQVMLAANTASLVFAGLLGLLTATGVATVWHVLALALLAAAAASFEVPARQSLMPELVPKEQVVNAIGLNSAAFNGAGIIGPALGALAIDWLGIGAAYLLNSISFLAVILGVWLMRTPRSGGAGVGAGMFGPLLEGLRYVRRTTTVLALVLTVAVVSLLCRPYTQLMPAFARDVLGGDASSLGLLMAASGVGAFGASLLVAYLGSFRRRGLVLLAMAGLFALALLAFAVSRWMLLSALLSGLAGFASTFYLSTTNTMLQLTAPPGLRGRVISLYALIVMGLMPLGTLVLGSLGDALGVPLAVALGSAIVLLWVGGVALAVPGVKLLE